MQEGWVQTLGWQDSPGVRNGSPRQLSCLENPMDREACQTTAHGVAKSRTRLSAHAHTHARTHTHIDTIIYEISAKFGIRKLELFNEILTRLMKIYRETVIKHYIHVGYNQ